jgi:hypothetical protein
VRQEEAFYIEYFCGIHQGSHGGRRQVR